ncbi:TRAP transporter large permease [Roseomonas hellenica]|uniref:TRAP transporter large permease protein n=1 Tax=Plastoroseomonas hellenica TaxID=2687306 RepID=A0ABS5ERP9_9PROT|nr:TRAP transporter large permease [Plastoroseomonas hellenica]MBR0662965.1 TRAP transporter large permease [Plastoroseomonas hellenica]
MTAALPSLLLVLLFALNVPVAFAIAISALSFFFLADGLPIDIFFQKMVAATDSYPLLAVPFFVLAGSLMNAAGITRRLLHLADALVGHMTGALAQACTVLATLLGGLTASSSADAAMLAKLFGPEMVRRGYSAAFAAAITSSAAIITALIPPGIGLIIYGYLADVSVGRLFLAGVVPGLLLALSLLVTTWMIARHRGYAPVRPHFVGFGEVLRAARDAVWALMIPVFIIVGLRYGLFTTTEAGAITVFVTIFIGAVIYRELNWAKLPGVLRETVLDTSSVMLLICAASAFGFYLAWERLPPAMASWMVGLTSDPMTLLLLINVLLIVLGTAVEGTAALIILTPIFVPVILRFGIDPVHFGILLVTNLTIAGITPPVGQMMFISCAVLKVPMEVYTVEILPILGAMLVVLGLITFLPQVSLFLPNLIMGS